MPKTYSQTYIFRQYPDYEKKMFGFIMNAERIDASSEEFKDVLYDFKRRNVSNALVKIITSKNVVLCLNPGNALPKAFKAFVAKDVRQDKNAVKAFVDVTDCVSFKNGAYVCSRIDWLISYVINAMVNYIYTLSENKLTGNASVLKDGGEAFANAFTYIIDRMYKISTVQQLRRRVMYASAIYYQVNLLGKSLDKNYDSIKANAMRIADIENRDAQIVDLMLKDTDFINIDTFVNGLSRIFNFKDLKTANVIAKWMEAFGTGTLFALEYFPAFSMMLTNTYVGGYLDQQLTIEKVTGNAMVSFSKTILQIGASV
jgi:hypothetical protein